MADDEFRRMLLGKRQELDEWFAMIRGDYHRQADALDVLLAAEGAKAPARVEDPDDDTSDDADTPTTRSFIRRTLAEAGGRMQMADVVARVAQMGSPASPDTVRGVLQKMLRSREVERIGRGTYRLISDLERKADDEAAEYRSSESPDMFEFESDDDPNPAYRRPAPSREGTFDTTG